MPERFSAGALFEVLRRNWWWLIVGLVVGLIAGVLFSVFQPARYQASTTFYISTQSSDRDLTGAYQGGLLSQQRVKSYSELLSSDRVAQAVVATARLQRDPASVASEITPSSSSETVLLTATVRSASPGEAIGVAQALDTVFPGLVSELERPASTDVPSLVSARVVEAPGAVAVQVAPVWKVNISLAAILGLLIAGAFVLSRNVLDTRVRSSAELAERCESPMLGSIHKSGTFAASESVRSAMGDRRVADDYALLRTNLQFVRVDNPARTVMITSSQQSEGKSTVAAGLAVSLALAGATTIVVDGDFRRPSLSQKLGIEDYGVGLTDILRGRAPVDSVVTRLDALPLWVLRSGAVPPDPAELLGSRRMQEVLRELGNKYDYVIIDTAPVLAVPDTAGLVSSVDGALFCGAVGVAKIGVVSDALSRLRTVGCEIVGVVGTMEPAAARSGYSSYYDAQTTRDRDGYERSNRSGGAVHSSMRD
jgi:capsular exopolysaccharide synthesis family protein